MPNRILAVLTAIILFSTSVFAAELAAGTTFANERVFIDIFTSVPDADGEYTVEVVTDIGRGDFVDGRLVDMLPHFNVDTSPMFVQIFDWQPPWDDMEFDSVLDKLFFIQFREGYEAIRRHSVDIGETVTDGNFELEILSSVALAGQSFTSHIMPENFLPDSTMIDAINIFEEDDIFESEAVTYTTVNVFTFVSLQDLSGEVSFDTGTLLNLTFADTLHGHARLLLAGDDAGQAYFVINHHTVVEGKFETIAISFGLNRILSDIQHFEIETDIDLVYLLAAHEATFVVDEYESDEALHWDPFWSRGGRRSGGFLHGLEAVIAEEGFNPFSMDAPILARGEMSIPFAEGKYITNIALQDNLLRIQIMQPAPDFTEMWDMGSRTSFHFTDSRVNISDISEMMGDIDWDAVDWENPETMAGFEAIFAMQSERFIHFLYNIDVSVMDEDWWFADGLRIEEYGYLLADLEILEYMVLVVSGAYYGVDLDMDLNVAAIEIPVINQHFKTDAVFEVVIQGEIYMLRDFSIDMAGIYFSIENGHRLFDLMAPHQMDIFMEIAHMIPIYLVYDSGESIAFQPDGGSMGQTYDMDAMFSLMQTYEADGYAMMNALSNLPSTTLLHFSGSFIDFTGLVAVRIGAAEIILN